jgi:hypothetical protein
MVLRKLTGFQGSFCGTGLGGKHLGRELECDSPMLEGG